MEGGEIETRLNFEETVPTHYSSYSLPLLRCDWQQVRQYSAVQCLHQIGGIAFLVRMEPPFLRVSTHDHPLIFSPEHIESGNVINGRK